MATYHRSNDEVIRDIELRFLREPRPAAEFARTRARVLTP
jgi:hypothetical protein